MTATEQIQTAIKASLKAGIAIMEVYESDDLMLKLKVTTLH